MFCTYLFPREVEEKVILETIHWLNDDQQINAILVQLPLPANFSEEKIVGAITPAKEVDGFGPNNLVKLKNHQEIIIPGVLASVLDLIKATGQPLGGKTALIVAKSQEFCESLQEILQREGLQARFVSPTTTTTKTLLKISDLVVVAVGQKNFLKAETIKPGVIIIDVGINKVGKKVYGDVAKSCWQKAGFISPVPGGVGPLTVAHLLQNVYQLYLQQKVKT